MSAGGAIVTIDLEGGFERVSAFMDALEIASLSSNLGDTRTIVTNPNTTTHAKLKPEEKKALGITEGLIRISVGLEDIEDSRIGNWHLRGISNGEKRRLSI
jgi:O-succinylhomoserine sulfhydrylase